MRLMRIILCSKWVTETINRIYRKYGKTIKWDDDLDDELYSIVGVEDYNIRYLVNKKDHVIPDGMRQTKRSWAYQEMDFVISQIRNTCSTGGGGLCLTVEQTLERLQSTFARV